nr:MAG TPA: hypothetical protein [Caudoviricetes sp.]
MWEESKHPRDDEGKFVEKGGYDGLRARRGDMRGMFDWSYTEMPTKKNWQRAVNIIGTEEDLEYVDADVFKKEMTREQLLQHIAERKENALAIIRAEEEKKLLEAQKKREEKEWEEKNKREKLDKLKANTYATDTVAQKLLDVGDRAYKAREAAENKRFQSQRASGYDGKSKSVRAINAEADGKFPISKAAQILGVTTIKIKQFLSPSEWHHTGAMYNETYYYDIADICDIADDLAYNEAAEIRENYSAESIRDFENIFGVKIK